MLEAVAPALPISCASKELAILTGHTILVVEEEPLIALDLRAALEEAGAVVTTTREADDTLEKIRSIKFSAAVVDWRPHSDNHRRIARALKRADVPFLFHATQPLEDVTTMRGVAIFMKPARPAHIVKALTLLSRDNGASGG